MSDLIAALTSEFRAIFTLRPVLSILVGGSLLYAAFYPQPYTHEALRDVPIALVDLDRTQSSRELARRVDASPDVWINATFADVPSAERAVYERAVSGLLVIPQYFERDLLHGRPSPVALYADASYFLIYQRVAGGVAAVARTFGTEIETSRLMGLGVDPALAPAAADPLVLTAVPLFNPQGGYATYVLPAALVLIVQQILLIGVGLLGTIAHGDGNRAGGITSPVRYALTTVAGKLLAYLAFEALIVPLYIIAVPYVYGLPRLGPVWRIMVFAVPFVLAVGALGLVVAALLRKPLAVQLAFAAAGLPFFFLAGFAWPTEAIPWAVQAPALLIPSTSGIEGFVRISQLGASLYDVRGYFLTLWLLAALYGSGAVWLEARRVALEPPQPASQPITSL